MTLLRVGAGHGSGGHAGRAREQGEPEERHEEKPKDLVHEVLRSNHGEVELRPVAGGDEAEEEEVGDPGHSGSQTVSRADAVLVRVEVAFGGGQEQRVGPP
jgi:hypothetical protein